jgi:DNA polymerase III epsilon subunit-like protein
MELIFKSLPIFCTMVASTDLCAIAHKDGNGFKWPKLIELHTKLFGAGFGGQHDASEDVLACARCFFELQKLGLVRAQPFPFGAENQFRPDKREPAWEGADEARRLLAAIAEFARNHPEFDGGFAKSLGHQFARRGCLSPKQINALNNIVRGWQICGPALQKVAIR